MRASMQAATLLPVFLKDEIRIVVKSIYYRLRLEEGGRIADNIADK
jgi:hypothetical protein